MPNHRLALLTLTAALTACGSVPTPGPRAADEAAIREARATQTRAIARGDLDTVERYWTRDISIRRALGHPVEGAAAARKVLEPSNPPPATPIVYQREATRVEVSSQWPLAYEEGRWSGHLGSATGPQILGGKYAAQWVKRDGRWLIRSEVFVALTCADLGCKAAALP